MILTGDCIEVMRTLDADSVDAVVTDPPYGLEFMGKEWDRLGDDPVSKSWDTKGRRENVPDRQPNDPGGRHGVHYKQQNPRCRNCGRAVNGRDTAKGFKVCSCDNPQWYQPNTFAVRMQEWHEAWGREALRVTKPGGYLLAFGGTRTHHRLVCGLEDAGWIIRDELDWIYASGFPKGKANLKPAHEPIVLARKPGPLRPLAIDACRISTTDDLNGGAYAKVGGRGESPSLHAGSGMNVPGKTVGREFEQPIGRWPSNVLLSDPDLFDVANPGVVGSGAVTGSGERVVGGPPRSETWILAEGSRDRSEAVMNYGDAGGYSRFFIIPKADRADREPVLRGQLERQVSGIGHAAGENDEEYRVRVNEPDPQVIAAYLREWRERAGLSMVEMDRKLGTNTMYSWFEGRKTGIQLPTPETWVVLKDILGFDDRHDEVMTTTHLVPRIRFKPNGREQPVVHRENVHPTVKPVDLMRHLIRLVTPAVAEDGKPGVVLDCFLGSGSTAIAAEMEGFAWVGIEKEPEYVAIAEARLNGTQRGLGLDVPAPTRRDIGKQRGNKDENGNPTLGSNRDDELIWKSYTPEPEEAT